jgi:hypothetical protein
MITNCHVHIFTIDHVPNQFARGIFPLSGLFTIRLIKRVYWLVTHIEKLWEYEVVKWIGKALYYTLILAIIWLFRLVGLTQFFRLIGPDTKAMVKRYWRMAKYSADSKSQLGIYRRLQLYYPKGTNFIVLPMDMEYMAAGAPAEKYATQLTKLLKVADDSEGTLYPFLFVDPRRLTSPDIFLDGLTFYDWIHQNIHKFKGIKIYPALGYFPFDWRLIPIYKLALERNIPVLTHCIQGVVYYRGSKRPEWNVHPFGGVALKKKSRKDFTRDFTHPLNYLVITDKDYLKHYLNKVKAGMGQMTSNQQKYWERHKGLFELEIPELALLRINLAHWGGEEEWDKYLKGYNPVEFNSPLNGLINPVKFRRVWEKMNWFSIINKMMQDSRFRYYTDISFTLHDNNYLNMLRVMLSDQTIHERVLFGTDFYMVAQKETEREFSMDVRGQIGEKRWEKIAEANPTEYLYGQKKKGR